MSLVIGAELIFDGAPPAAPMPVTTTLALPTGGFLVTWVDIDSEIHLQTFDDNGTLLASAEITRDVSSYLAFFAPTLAVLANGTIAISWTSLSATSPESDVLLHLFTEDLLPLLSAPIPVSTYGTDSQVFPQLSALDNDGLAIAWFGDTAGGTFGTFDVAARVFGAGAIPTDIQVNSWTDGDQNFPNVTSLQGGFVVSWFDEDSDEAFIRVFNNDGTGGNETAANDLPIGLGGVLATSALASGGFVTAWSGETAGDPDAIAFRIFDDSGVAQTLVTQANSLTSGVQLLSSLTTLAAGGFVVAWGACGCTGSGSGLAVFNDDGTVRVSEIVLEANSDTTPTVKALSDGSFVAAWVYGDFLNGDLGFAVRVFNSGGDLRYSENVDLNDNIDILTGAPLEITSLSTGGFVLSVGLYTGLYSRVFDLTSDGVTTDAPRSANSAVTVVENASYVFSLADFPFSDPQNDGLAGVQISSLPANGVMHLNNLAVTAGQTINPADIAAGRLVWKPVPGTSGETLSSLSFTVIDTSGSTSDSYSIVFSVTRINDAPLASDVTVTIEEDGGYVFSTTSFAFWDGDGDKMIAVKIVTLPSNGKLTLNGQAVTAGQSISASDITGGKLLWTPPADGHGAELTSFTFKVQDNGGSTNGGIDVSLPHRFVFDVTSINDAPELSQVGPVITSEHAKIRLDVLSGVTDADGDTVMITAASLVSGAGNVSVNKAGKIVFDPTNSSAQPLGAGESRTATVRYTVSDGQGGEAVGEIEITINSASTVTVRGTSARDSLIGGSTADRIWGYRGNDKLDGGAGDDVLRGGKGADLFIFGESYGHDVITDFRPDLGDRVDLSNAVGIKNLQDLFENHLTEVGRNLLITCDDGSELVLKRVNADDLDSGNFVF